MDASAGQRKPGVVNWRGVEEPKDAKKEKKKAHWLVAKEAGKRVNGSEKRKKRRLERDDDVPQDAPEMSKKARPTEREAATSVVLGTPQQQRDFLWSELRESLGNDAGLMPPVEAFMGCTLIEGTFADRLKDALAQCKRKSWAREVERTPAKARKGHPRVLVVSSSAIRCVDLIADMRSRLAGDDHPVIAKLWAKHMKVDEQKEFLASHYSGAVVGTPNRLGKLVADKALRLSKVRLMVVDCAPNVKGQTIFNMVETRADLFAFLGGCCLARLRKGACKIALIG